MSDFVYVKIKKGLVRALWDAHITIYYVKIDETFTQKCSC